MTPFKWVTIVEFSSGHLVAHSPRSGVSDVPFSLRIRAFAGFLQLWRLRGLWEKIGDCGLRQCRSILRRVVGPGDFDGFEWAEEKSERCYEERGFDFAYAARLFDGDFIEWEDRRRDWGEPRIISVGEVEARILTVVWTPRGNLRRIISARPASRAEREKLYGKREAHQQRSS